MNKLVAKQALKQPDAQPCLWANLLSKKYTDYDVLTQLRHEFITDNYVKLPGLFSLEAFTDLKAELKRIEPFAIKKNFVMEGYETPRVLSVLGGQKILKLSPMLKSLYSDENLSHFLQMIVGTEIYPCLHPEEFMVANFLLCAGATHGWHLDDPSYALVIIFEAPCELEGGLLELIPNWNNFLDSLGADPKLNVDPLVELARCSNLVQTKHHASGDAYLLRADRCLHQVTELLNDNISRIVLNLAYESTPNPSYSYTATRLYGDQNS
ncbi:hypothetical protein F7734_15070 [Scytonema sp. UIC 10036]|uniref:HalD/BesD family halogenase n=1 Tax=Scytonema sp. UIC 10036 TaxID=2304196 RepID=UPI0012DAD74E|nr:hypothetical protein [Scytonema sp. UIC 10036]MUG93669.1 hypothetical protein [Scytonema sp. UIC 10036]